MNGRIYDPLVGRFLSADNNIQDEYSTQHYNRYSYCLNNPLRYTDPSGWKMKALDESDAAFDAYFSLMSGETGWFNSAALGGGASSGGWGGAGGVLPGWASSGSHYDNASGAYVNGGGDIVGWNTVLNKSVKPNSLYTITQTFTSIDHGKTFTGNGHFTMVELNPNIVSTGLYPTFYSKNSALDFKNSLQEKRLVAMGWGVEASAFIFSFNIGWFTSGKTGGIVTSFSSGISNSLSFSMYGASVSSGDDDFIVKDMSGRGVEANLGYGIVGYTRASNNFDNPSYYINQYSVGVGYFGKSAGLLNTGTFVIPTLPVLFVDPIY